MPVSPLRGDPPTGEPDAGEPPVRFGGRGKQTQLFLPTPIRTASLGLRFFVSPCLAVNSVCSVISACYTELKTAVAPQPSAPSPQSLSLPNRPCAGGVLLID